MNKSSSPARAFRICSAIFLFAIASSLSVRAQERDWRPVTQEELQMKTPKVEPDADAEVILWDVYVAGEDKGQDYHQRS